MPVTQRDANRADDRAAGSHRDGYARPAISHVDRDTPVANGYC